MGCAFTSEIQSNLKTDQKKRNRLTTIDCRRKSTRVVEHVLQNVTVIMEKLTQEHIKKVSLILQQHQLFSQLNKQQIKAICDEIVIVQGKPGQYVFKQGQLCHSFFIIQCGSVSVQVDGTKVGELKKGATFGQLALLFRAVRAASIKCITQKITFYVIKPAIYRTIIQMLRTKQYTKNKQIIQSVPLFQCLTNKQKYMLANLIKVAHFNQNQVIFQTGQVSQGIYIIDEGQVQITIPGIDPIKLGPLQVFGQSALKQNGRRVGRAKCLNQTKCLVIGKKDIQKSLGSSVKNLIFFNTQKWALMRQQYFNFKDYDTPEYNKIIMGFDCIQKKAGQKIDGQLYKGLIIVLQGKINGKNEGTIFNIQKIEDIVQAKCQTLTKDDDGYFGFISFNKLNDIMATIQSWKKMNKAASNRMIAIKNQKLDMLAMYDLQVVKKLGQGQFGQVFLVKHKKSGILYAVKCISKKAVREQQMELSVMEERKILQKAVFPYIVGFVRAYHDKNNIFLLMQYLKGKQMFDVIREFSTLNKPIARYYFGCLLLSLEYLHLNNIIYRDIKPQNSVVDSNGKVYLIDLGTAKQLSAGNMFKTFTIIGTPHYMAPQVFQGKGYSFQADFWSLGIILYQFVCGRLPFGQNVHGDPYSLYSIIKKGKIQYPKSLQDQKVKKLIDFILVKDPTIRSQQVTFQKIKKQQYFQNFNWQDLLQEKILPPYIPRDFRSKNATQKYQTNNIPFISHLYNGKSYGQVVDWDCDTSI